MSQKQAIVCSNVRCGRSFTEPIKLSVIQADDSVENYEACPHCFSRVNTENKKVWEAESSSDKRKKRQSEAAPSDSAKAVQENARDIEKDKLVGCTHFVGYLKTRPKDSPIPDTCLTCRRIMDCM